MARKYHGEIKISGGNIILQKRIYGKKNCYMNRYIIWWGEWSKWMVKLYIMHGIILHQHMWSESVNTGRNYRCVSHSVANTSNSLWANVKSEEYR